MNDNLWGTLLLGIIFFLIGVFVTRWIFGIDKILSYLQTQTANQKAMRKIITKLAERQGLSKEEIDKIEYEAGDEASKI